MMRSLAWFSPHRVDKLVENWSTVFIYMISDNLDKIYTLYFCLFRPDQEEHVKSHDYLYDVIAAWEL